MPAVHHIANEIYFVGNGNTISEANFVWSSTYMPPTFPLLRISEKERRLKEDRERDFQDFPAYFANPGFKINFHDMAGKNLHTDVKKEVLGLATRARLKNSKGLIDNYLVIPTHLHEELERATKDEIRYEAIAYFFPHISLESPPDLSVEVSDLYAQVTDGNVLNDVDSVISNLVNMLGHFGLSIYKFEHKADNVHTVAIQRNSKS